MPRTTRQKEYREFHFIEGMSLGKDLKPLKEAGWLVSRGSHKRLQTSTGTWTNCIILERVKLFPK
jgi:hypothetical protein